MCDIERAGSCGFLTSKGCLSWLSNYLILFMFFAWVAFSLRQKMFRVRIFCTEIKHALLGSIDHVAAIW
jgi:hypothetical protein